MKNVELMFNVQEMSMNEMNEQNGGGPFRFMYRLSHAYLEFKSSKFEYDRIKEGKIGTPNSNVNVVVS